MESRNAATQQHGRKYFACRHPPPMTLGVKIQHLQNSVMLHIKLKGITKCSNMVANILAEDPPPPPPTDPRVKIQLLQNMVMLHILN